MIQSQNAMLDDYPTTQQPHFLDQGKKDEKKKES
jgi:hypothetical protein